MCIRLPFFILCLSWMEVWRGELQLRREQPLWHQPWGNTGLEAASFPDPERQHADNEPYSSLRSFPSDTACLCQGPLSMTSGFLWSRASWWLHPECVMQALNRRASLTTWCHSLAPGPALSGFHHAPAIPDRTRTVCAWVSWGRLLPEWFDRNTLDADTSEIPFLFVHPHEISQSSAKRNAERFCRGGGAGPGRRPGNND